MDRLHYRAGIGERPAGPAGPGREHRGDQFPLGIGQRLEAGHAFQGASWPWIHSQTRPKRAAVPSLANAEGRGYDVSHT